MGITEEIFANAATQGWGMLPVSQRQNIRTGTVAIEAALKLFNEDTADDKITPDEFEAVVKQIMAAMGGTAGSAFQAMFWSLLKRS